MAALLIGGVNSACAAERLVAIILTGNLDRYQAAHTAFLENFPPLSEVRFYVQNPNPDPISVTNSLRKAVALGSELIITYGAQAAAAAQKEARDVPVLFGEVYDPLALGLVRCHQHDNCEMSGISSGTPLQTLLRIFSSLSPEHPTVCALYSSRDAGSIHQCQVLESLSAKSGLPFRKYDLQRRAELEAVLDTFPRENRVLFISDSDLVQQMVEDILVYAEEKDLLVLSQVPDLCERGALLGLAADPREQGTKLAEYASAVLHGTDINELPIVTPKKVDLVINLKVARDHQLKIPFEALSLATKVVK